MTWSAVAFIGTLRRNRSCKSHLSLYGLYTITGARGQKLTDGGEMNRSVPARKPRATRTLSGIGSTIVAAKLAWISFVLAWPCR